VEKSNIQTISEKPRSSGKKPRCGHGTGLETR